MEYSSIGRVPWDAELAGQLERVIVARELGPAAAEAVTGIVEQFGFAILESESVSLDSRDDRAAELETFGAALGELVVQSPRRELIEDVRDYSDVEPIDTRGYRSSGELSPHSDPPTLIVLNCLRPARSGGESSLVSVLSIVERMQQRRPDLVAELFEPVPTWQVEGQHGRAGEGVGSARAVLATHDGVLSCVIYRPFIERAAVESGQPLSAAMVEALDLFDELSKARDLTLRFMLRPGQSLILHNRSVLHARTDYTDWPDPEKRRHLLRMWIDAPDAFPVHPSHGLGDIFGPDPTHASN